MTSLLLFSSSCDGKGDKGMVSMNADSQSMLVSVSAAAETSS